MGADLTHTTVTESVAVIAWRLPAGQAMLSDGIAFRAIEGRHAGGAGSFAVLCGTLPWLISSRSLW
jgi:hypothetical protein